MKIEFYGQIFEKYLHISVHEIASSGRRVFPRGRSDDTRRGMLGCRETPLDKSLL
jgi:hypothetical protein